mmetsp:Transcript_23205/g.55929  ORF Transcript_23205/g.55929 Transcript_23205/m.55929 type:complete len:1314 (-) Transcript_23205:373-4314(-)
MADTGRVEVVVHQPAEEAHDEASKASSEKDVNTSSTSATRDASRARKPSTRSHVEHKGHNRPSIIASCLSGVVCGLMFYVFSAVFAAMIFDESGANIPEHHAIGVSMNVMSAAIGGIMFARFSSCRAVMAGPDITPYVFMTEMARQISSSLCPGGTSSCAPESREKLLPTVLVSIWMATAITGATFFALGKFKLTSIVGFMPANVTGSFLSCIGYKVMYYAIEVACGSKIKYFKEGGKYVQIVFGTWSPSYYHKGTDSWRGGWSLILPALFIGFPLYYLKRKHIGKPTYNFPGMIIIPTAMFYIALFGSGGTLESARHGGWMFQETESSDFWAHWEAVYGSLGKVDWSQLPSCLPVLAVMLPIVSLDNMLKLASSETALEMDLDYNKEIKIGGAATLINAFLIGAPAYGQTKFNVLNYGFTHSSESPVASYMMGIFCAILFFAGVPLLDYLPRLLLSGLLMFSAAGFLIEHLFDARLKYNRYSYASIWIVWISNVIAGELLPQYSLLVAILVGVVLSAFGFAYTFARNSKLSPPRSGEQHSSLAVRSAAQEMKLGVLGRWYYIFSAHGFVFFGTASSLYRSFKAHCAESQKLPRCERTKMIIFDMTQVFGIDATAEAVFNKIKKLAVKQNIELVWAGLNPKLTEKFDKRSVIAGTHSYKSLDAALKYVEDELLRHVHNLAQQWLVDDTCRHIYNRAMLHDALTAHVVSDGSVGPSQLFKWSIKRSCRKGEIVFEEGDADDGLYLLYMGKVDLIAISPSSETTVYPGAFFNEHVLYSGNASGALYTAIATEDSVMLRLDASMRQEMQWHDPHTAYTVVLAVFRQAELRNPQYRHPSHAKPDIFKYSKPLTLALTAANSDAGSSSHDDVFHIIKPGVSGARKNMHGDASKANLTYRNLLSKVDVLPKSLKEFSRKDPGNALLTPSTMEEMQGNLEETSLFLDEKSRLGTEKSTSLAAEKSVTVDAVRLLGLGSEDVPEANLLNRHHDGRAPDDMRHETILDREFINGSDFRVPLTQAQEEHYRLIFQLNDHNSKGHLQVSDLSRFMFSLGHGIPPEELEEMLHEVGIDDDQDGAINEGDFLEFVRRSLVANLPSSRIPLIDKLYRKYTEPKDDIMEAELDLSSGLEEESANRVRLLRKSFNERTSDKAVTIPKHIAFKLMHELGFELDEHTFDDLFADVDYRGDGTVTRDELITALGMLKKNILEVMELEKAFTRLRQGRNKGPPLATEKSSKSGLFGLSRASKTELTPRGSKTDVASPPAVAPPMEDHMVYASDLVLTLGVTAAEAEEMIFIADLQENNAIDFTEFKQVVVNWS